MKIKVNVLNRGLDMPGDLLDAVGGDELIARIFYNRGYKDPNTVRQMLDDELYIPTKYGEFPGMKQSTERLARALTTNETILVYGDYDVDGVTSTATLVQCFRMFTQNVLYHVPDRFSEGYGMNEKVIASLPAKNVSLIVTCDCGVANVKEIGLAKSLGMDVIITDHHNIPDELPPADAILNPKLLEEGHKARNLSGCGMVFFLCISLLRHFNKENGEEAFLDLLALSLVADVVSLNGENRYLLKKGLPCLFGTKRIGLKELFSIIEGSGKLDNEEDIAFQIAPRINAAGRMESARIPVELLLSEDPVYAKELALKIDILNSERKRVQQQVIDEATEMVHNEKINKTVLVLYNSFWHHGVLGIAAGKISELFRKPSILLSLKEDGFTVVGSARSVDDIDLFDLIKKCGKKLKKFGGHKMAAGLSLNKEDLEAFTKEIEQAAEELFFIKETICVDADQEMDVSCIDDGFYRRICKAGPYGEGFRQPVFFTRGITVVSDRKTEKNHHIMVIEGDGEARITAVKWFGGDVDLQGKVFDITYSIGKNSYKNSQEIRLTVDRIIEADGKPKEAFLGKFIDERGKSVEWLFNKYPNSVVFFEGIDFQCKDREVISRVDTVRAKTVIFLSTPVNTEVFREVIARSNPDTVVISFNKLPDYSWKEYITRFLGVLKYIINHEKGICSLELLCTKMCVEGPIMKATLKYLMMMGKIQFSINEENGNVFIRKSCGGMEKSIYITEKKLKDALLEKQAYQMFLLKLEVDKFIEYLK
ncbi:MAG: single-stranded-DNA-specific exonuclease RecJ [Clostridia bacterium]|nr:single-stranded-DNA-specific exonuclease RecJ [Clostridia bacterium]